MSFFRLLFMLAIPILVSSCVSERSTMLCGYAGSVVGKEAITKEAITKSEEVPMNDKSLDYREIESRQDGVSIIEWSAAVRNDLDVSRGYGVIVKFYDKNGILLFSDTIPSIMLKPWQAKYVGNRVETTIYKASRIMRVKASYFTL